MAATLERATPAKEASLTPGIVPLEAAVQNYAWGMKPSENSLVSQLYSENASVVVDDQTPYAELWIGTHASGEARLQSDKSTTLAEFLERSNAPEIPYLLKVLSVAKPLSIQAHPDKQRAKVLHAKNPKAYRDENHKPEMSIALTEFEAMCNFRPIHEITGHVKDNVPLARLCGVERTMHALTKAKEPAERRDALRSMFSNLMNSKEEEVSQAIKEMEQGIRGKSQNDEVENLFLRLLRYYPNDVGCLAAYLLNFVRISPGQAFFMAANEPHAYLKGQCVEIMANSDNVVRAGLTPKFKDVTTLIEMLTYHDGPPRIMQGEALDAFTTLYRPPAKEFQLTRYEIPPGSTHKLCSALGSDIILCLEGIGSLGVWREGNVTQEREAPVSLKPGSVYCVLPGNDLVAFSERNFESDTSARNLVLFRAGPNKN